MCNFFRLEPVSGLIMSVGELVPEVHRTSRGQVDQPTEAMEQGEVEAESTRPTEDDSAEHRRVKTTLEDWENEQVCLH